MAARAPTPCEGCPELTTRRQAAELLKWRSAFIDRTALRHGRTADWLARELVDRYRAGLADEHGYVKLSPWDVAKAQQRSLATASRHLAELHKQGALLKVHKPIPLSAAEQRDSRQPRKHELWCRVPGMESGLIAVYRFLATCPLMPLEATESAPACPECGSQDIGAGSSHCHGCGALWGGCEHTAPTATQPIPAGSLISDAPVDTAIGPLAQRGGRAIMAAHQVPLDRLSPEQLVLRGRLERALATAIHRQDVDSAGELIAQLEALSTRHALIEVSRAD